MSQFLKNSLYSKIASIIELAKQRTSTANNKMNYYLGGYHLIALRPFYDGVVYTCSECINDNLLRRLLEDEYSSDWKEYLKEINSEYGLNEYEIKIMKQWLLDKYAKKQIISPNVFPEIQLAKKYKDKFFKNNNQVKLLAIYFDENGIKEIFDDDYSNDTGTCKILEKKIPEKDVEETLLGYDLIGIEDGEFFHTFHCHSIAEELSSRFNITLNKYGLFDNCPNWKPVVDYMNDEKSKVEDVPWFVVKVKLAHDFSIFT